MLLYLFNLMCVVSFCRTFAHRHIHVHALTPHKRHSFVAQQVRMAKMRVRTRLYMQKCAVLFLNMLPHIYSFLSYQNILARAFSFRKRWSRHQCSYLIRYTSFNCKRGTSLVLYRTVTFVYQPFDLSFHYKFKKASEVG